MTRFHVSANDTPMGSYDAIDEQGARDLCAIEAGYASEADMVAQLEAAVDERKKQLADLEMVAAQLGAGRAEAQADAMEQAVVFAPIKSSCINPGASTT